MALYTYAPASGSNGLGLGSLSMSSLLFLEKVRYHGTLMHNYYIGRNTVPHTVML